MFLLLGCWTIQAAKVTATIDAWNKASLHGDSAAMKVQYTTTTKSGTRITAENSALFTLSCLPACTFNTITVYIRSNSAAGAGMVMMKIANRTWLVASGNYNQWPGMSDYSTVALPISCLSKPLDVRYGSALSIQIECTTNSLYLEKVEIDYSLAPPTAHTVTLQWLAQDGTFHCRQLIEEEALAGVELPSVGEQDSVMEYAGETWYWQGWCEQNLAAQIQTPLYWQPNDWYGPEDDCTLYALYTNAPTRMLQPDTTYTTGEYAVALLAEKQLLFLSGPWQSGRIALQTVPLDQDGTKELVWSLNQLNDAYRYLFTFEQDSVTIYHPQTKTSIGYLSQSGGNKKIKWAWRKACDGSLFLYSTKNELTQKYMHLTLGYTELNNTNYVQYASGEYKEDFPYWRLFPTADIPSNVQLYYTTFLDATPIPVVSEQPKPQGIKWLNADRQIIIRYTNTNYNLLGQPL